MSVPHDSFNKGLFRQPSLNEGKLKPAAYRKYTKHPDGEGVKLSLSYLEEGGAHKDLSGIESPHMGRPLLSPHSKSPRRFNEEHYEKHSDEYDSDNERGGDEEEDGNGEEEVEQEVNKLLGADTTPVSPVPAAHGSRSRQGTLNAVTSPIFSGSLSSLTTPVRASDGNTGSHRLSAAPKEKNDGIVLSRVPSTNSDSIN